MRFGVAILAKPMLLFCRMPKLLLLLLSLTFLQCEGRDVYLKFQFSDKADRQYRLKLNQTSTMRNTNETYALSGTFCVRQKVEHQYPNGDAKCLIQVDSVKQQTDLLSPAEQEHLSMILLHSPLRVRLSPYGDFLELEETVELPSADFLGLNLSRFLVELYPILPHSGIPVGGEWDREQQFPFENGAAKGTLYFKKHFKLAAIQNRENHLCAKFEMDILVHLGLSSGTALRITPRDGAFAKGRGTLYFDIVEGCFLEGQARLAGAIEASMQTPTGLFGSPISFEQTMEIALLEPPTK